MTSLGLCSVDSLGEFLRVSVRPQGSNGNVARERVGKGGAAFLATRLSRNHCRSVRRVVSLRVTEARARERPCHLAASQPLHASWVAVWMEASTSFQKSASKTSRST